MSVLPPPSVQTKINLTQSVLQIRPTKTASPRNATGVYVSTSDPLSVGKVKSTIPPTARGKLAPVHFYRSPVPSTAEKKRQEPLLSSSALEIQRSHPEGSCPKRHEAIATSDPLNFEKLTKRNPRQFTKINNSGVKHFELLRQQRVTGEQEQNGVSEATLIGELNRNRTFMLGIATCFDQLNVKSFDNVKTLLPKRRSRSSPAQRSDPKPQEAMGTAKLMAHLPHNAQHKLTQYLPPRAPLSRFEGLSSPRRKDNGASSSDPNAPQLSSSELHRAGFLNRSGPSDSRGQTAITDRDVERQTQPDVTASNQNFCLSANAIREVRRRTEESASRKHRRPLSNGSQHPADDSRRLSPTRDLLPSGPTIPGAADCED